MMLVNAATMESPVTTVSRTAANAAAAIVPIAYWHGTSPTSAPIEEAVNRNQSPISTVSANPLNAEIPHRLQHEAFGLSEPHTNLFNTGQGFVVCSHDVLGAGSGSLALIPAARRGWLIDGLRPESAPPAGSG
jgi:hypothetical protein